MLERMYAIWTDEKHNINGGEVAAIFDGKTVRIYGCNYVITPNYLLPYNEGLRYMEKIRRIKEEQKRKTNIINTIAEKELQKISDELAILEKRTTYNNCSLDNFSENKTENNVVYTIWITECHTKIPSLVSIASTDKTASEIASRIKNAFGDFLKVDIVKTNLDSLSLNDKLLSF